MQRPSRLRPAHVDPLDNVGLVSKGDTSLLSHKTQESYFDIIKTRYRAFTNSSKTQEEGEHALAVSLASLSLSRDEPSKSPDPTKKESLSTASTLSTSSELSTILMGMRKLREAIVASSRTDRFAKDVYFFIIRTTILLGHPESYHPALLHLFRHLHSFAPLSDEEEREFATYYILDLACRQHDLAAAFRLRNLYDCKDGNIGMALTALVHGDWVLFWRAKDRGNVYERRLMGWADERMVNHTVQCLGRSYLSIPRGYVERCTDTDWENLKKLKKLPWVLDGETVMIKQVRKR